MTYFKSYVENKNGIQFFHLFSMFFVDLCTVFDYNIKSTQLNTHK